VRVVASHNLSLSVIRVYAVPHTSDERTGDVLTLEEAAALLKLPRDAVRSRAEEGDLPGRRFGKEWRFARVAVLAWLADGEPHEQRRTKAESRRLTDEP